MTDEWLTVFNICMKYTLDHMQVILYASHKDFVEKVVEKLEAHWWSSVNLLTWIKKYIDGLFGPLSAPPKWQFMEEEMVPNHRPGCALPWPNLDPHWSTGRIVYALAGTRLANGQWMTNCHVEEKKENSESGTPIQLELSKGSLSFACCKWPE